MKYLGVFSDAHATQLNSGGFTQVVIRFHPPDVVLPLEEIGELSEQGSGSGRPRKRRGLPVADPVVQASSRAQELSCRTSRTSRERTLRIPSSNMLYMYIYPDQ